MPQFIKIEDKKEWQQLFDKALFKTFFHEPKWESFLESAFKWLKFEHYNYNDQVLLSFAKCRIFGLEKLVSHPFCEYGGPLFLSQDLDWQQFHRDLFEQIKAPFKISFHHKLALSGIVPGRNNSFFIEELDNKSESELWQNLRKTLRHSIKKAENSGLIAEKCQNSRELKDFYKVYLESCKKNQTLAKPYSFFKHFFSSDKAEIILAKHKNTVVAGSIFLFYKPFIHYFLNASGGKYKELCASHLILWSQIKKHLGQDWQIMDLGGTRQGSPLEVFKSGWDSKKYRICQLSNVAESKDLASSKLRKLWGILPLWLIKIISPYLLKYKL